MKRSRSEAIPPTSAMPVAKRARLKLVAASTNTPWDLPGEIWRDEILPWLLDFGWACRTRVMLRRTCKWFADTLRRPSDEHNVLSFDTTEYRAECAAILKTRVATHCLSWGIALEGKDSGCGTLETEFLATHSTEAARSLLLGHMDGYHALMACRPVSLVMGHAHACLSHDLVNPLRHVLSGMAHTSFQRASLIIDATKRGAKQCFRLLCQRRLGSSASGIASWEADVLDNLVQCRVMVGITAPDIWAMLTSTDVSIDFARIFDELIIRPVYEQHMPSQAYQQPLRDKLVASVKQRLLSELQ